MHVKEFRNNTENMYILILRKYNKTSELQDKLS